MPPVVQVIANPEASAGKGAKMLPRLKRKLEEAGMDHRLFTTEHPGHAEEIVRSLESRADSSVLVVGGDGTLHEVANALLERPDGWNPRLAVLPVGTGNDFHRMVRESGTVAGVVATLKSGTTRSFEVGRVAWASGSAHFVNLLGVGIDVAVLRRRRRFRFLPGLLQYLAALGSALLSFRPVPVRVRLTTADDQELELTGDALLVAVTVGPSVGGGFRLSPHARPDDGNLDLFFVERLGLLGVARHLPGVLRGKRVNSPKIHQHQIRRARIETEDGSPIPFEMDGELMPEPSSWLQIEVVPDALTILETTGGNVAEPTV